MNGYRLLADLIVVVHFAFVAFVVLGLVAIVVGAIFRWQWVRNVWFRIAHFAAIAVVAAEAIGGVVCPLTEWEYKLRVAAGDAGDPRSFIAQWIHRLMFFNVPEWVLTTCYCTFAAVVLIALLAVPPRWPRRRRSQTPE